MDWYTDGSNWYEVHYVLGGSKKRLVVQKNGMSELEAWLCAILYVAPDAGVVSRVQNYAAAVSLAAKYQIVSVRWNRLQGQKPDKPGLRVFGHELDSAVFQSFRSE